jgi:hypothetical protein
MSAGGFIVAVYGSTLTALNHRIRIQPETLSLEVGGVSNDQIAGAIQSPISATVSGGRRGRGRLFARLIRFRFQVGDEPPGYKPDSIITLPWLDPATFAAASGGGSGTYTINGTSYGITVVGGTNEAAS